MKNKKIIGILCCILAFNLMACNKSDEDIEDLVVTEIGSSITTTSASNLKGIGLHNKEEINVQYNVISTSESDNSTVSIIEYSVNEPAVIDTIYLNNEDKLKNSYTCSYNNKTYIIYEMEKGSEPNPVAGTNTLYKTILTKDDGLHDDLTGEDLYISHDDLTRDAVYDSEVENGKYLYDTFTATIDIVEINSKTMNDVLNRLKNSSKDSVFSIDIVSSEVSDIYSHFVVKYTACYVVGTSEDEEITLGISNYVHSKDIITKSKEDFNNILTTINEGTSMKTPEEILADGISSMTEVTTNEVTE